MAGRMTVERPPKLVCFDLDGTVMLSPNSLQFLLQLNRAPEGVLRPIDRRELSGDIHWIAADYERAPFIAGLPVAAIEENLDGQLVAIGGLDLVLRTLRDHGIATVVITSGPIEVAQAFGRRFAFAYCFGSEFETSDAGGGAYTGRITQHLGSAGKVDCLVKLCRARGIALEDCAAVGDGASDLALFRAVGTSIGFNVSVDAASFAQHEVRGDDLSAILPLLLGRRDRAASD